MPPQRRHRSPVASPYRTVAALLLLDSETPDEELVALTVLSKAFEDEEAQGRSKKYGKRGPYDRKKSVDFFHLMLTEYSDRWFRSWLRMGRDAFWYLNDQIKDNPIFQSHGRRPQRPSYVQLATFLLRWSHPGAIKIAGVLSLAEGTVYLYCRRVRKAFHQIKHRHLWWPGKERRQFLKTEMEVWGFPGCIGIVDGTLFRLADKPKKHGFTFWCRKKMYAIVCQATVDHRAVFTSYELGWPGSVHDSTVFTGSDMWIHKERYFDEDEYILADKGYPLTRYTIRPFSEVDLKKNPQKKAERRAWNKTLSSLRIKVEHAFGLLKGRFPNLRSIEGSNLQIIYKSIESLMVIHNILMEFGDDPEDIEGFNGEEDWIVAHGQSDYDIEEDALVRGADQGGPGQGHGVANADELYRMGLFRRKQLVEFYLENDI